VENLVWSVVRFVLFRQHEKPGVPIKRQDINEVITVSGWQLVGGWLIR
jgi:LPS O-antigen subunit length determinant protein (WzzB/FepE family)